MKKTIPVSRIIGRLKPSTAFRYWIPSDGTQAARSTNCSPPRAWSYCRKTASESASVAPEKTAATCFTARGLAAGMRRIAISPATQQSRMALKYGKPENSIRPLHEEVKGQEHDAGEDHHQPLLHRGPVQP